MFRSSSKPLLGVLVVVTGLLLGSAVVPANAAPAHARAAAPASADFETQLLQLINKQRAKVTNCKAAKLKMHSALREAARKHSARMAKKENLAHQLPGEAKLQKRVEKAGYKKWNALAENIAFDQKAPKSIFNAWMNSSGHRRNMLSCAYNEGGIGVTYKGSTAWVTLDLGHRRK